MATKYNHELKFDIFGLKKGQLVLEAHPQLSVYPELVLHGSEKNDKFLRYCILCTDPGSGLMRLNDIEMRHREAWALAGLPEGHPREAGAFDFSDEPVAAMSYALLREFDNLMLGFVLAGEAMLWQDIQTMRTPIGATAASFDEAGPAGETEAEKKKRLNRESWAMAADTEDKKQRARSIRGDLFDSLPKRIRDLQMERETVFNGDRKLEKSVRKQHLKAEGMAERMAREYKVE